MDKSEKNYALDLGEIMRFVFEGEENNTNTEITESYGTSDDGNEIKLLNKILKESKDVDVTNGRTIRYDFVKLLLDNVFTMMTPEVEDEFDEGGMTFGDTIVLNTLINNGMLKEVK